MFESIYICFLKLCTSVLKTEFDWCHDRAIYYQDKYNMCATLFLGPLSKFYCTGASAQSHEGCARCFVSLLPQVSHIQCERIAGYIALRTGREAACWEKKHLPGEMIQGIGETERRIKWTQFQRGNNGGHGVWCSFAGHENDLVDDGINHTFVALNVNEDMFGCCFFFFF